MDASLLNLLRNVGTETDYTSFTHITTIDTIKRWKINGDSLSDFWKNYCDLVDIKTNGREDIPPEPLAKLCLAEKTSEDAPLIVSFTFKFHFDENDSISEWVPYDDNFLAYLCHVYQSIILENFHTSDETDHMELVVTVLESATHWIEADVLNQEQYAVYEVRLQFPYSRLDVASQKRVIRNQAIKLLHRTNGLSKLQRAPIGGWEQIIATDSVEVPVVLYGSSTVQNRPKLELTHMWGWIPTDMIDNKEYPPEISLEDAFIPTNHKDVLNGRIDSMIFDDNPDLEFWLPMFFSLEYWQGILKPKAENNNKLLPQTQNLINNDKWQIAISDDKDIDICASMLPLLDKSRYSNEITWNEIGKALYHAAHGAEEGLTMWIKSTEKSLASLGTYPEFMKKSATLADSCRNLYRTFSGKPITVKTLGWYAREDNPEKYGEWHKAWCMRAIGKSINLTHTDVSTAIYRVNWLDYIYHSPDKTWYHYYLGRWTKDDEALDLKGSISADFVKRLEAIRAAVAAEVRNKDDNDSAENGDATIKKIDTFIVRTKTVGFKSSIVEELKTMFKNNKFEKCADANPNVLGIANGILEVSGNMVYFRSGKPEDYVLLNTNVPYESDFTWESPLVVECMRWFAQTFPDPQLQHHFLKFAASCLKGRNSDKIFPIFTGEGNNSKSMIVKLFEKTFGEYCIKFDMSNVTSRNQNASGPTPQLARSKAVRIAFMDEAADDVPIHKETIKRVVGGDSFYTRKNYDNGGDIEVFFKLVLSCNKVPIIPKADKAIKNRTRLFPFMSTWSPDAPENIDEQYEKNHFKMDERFEERIPLLTTAFLWIMVQYFPYYSKEKLPDPQIVIDHTEAYWRDNDVYAQFAADCVDIVNINGEKDVNARVSFNEIYSQFRIWYKEAFDGSKIPDKQLVKTDLCARWGKLVGKYWYGVKLKDPEDPTKAQAPETETKEEIPKNENKKVSKQQELPKFLTDIVEKERNRVKKVPEAISQAKAQLQTIKANNLKGNALNDTLSDIKSKLMSPGIIAKDSGELGFENIEESEEEELGVIAF